MQNDLVKVKNQCFGYELLIFRLMHFANKLLIKQMYTLKTSENFLFPVFKKASERDELHNIEVKDALEAFLCLLDGLMVELLYAGLNRFETRLDASWKVFWRGLSN